MQSRSKTQKVAWSRPCNAQSSKPLKRPTEKDHGPTAAEARTALLSVISDMDLSGPGTRPFRLRSPVARKNVGSREPALVKAMDVAMMEVWENDVAGQQSLWALNCLTYAGGKAVESLGEWMARKVRQLTQTRQTPPPPPPSSSPPTNKMLARAHTNLPPSGLGGSLYVCRCVSHPRTDLRTKAGPDRRTVPAGAKTWRSMIRRVQKRVPRMMRLPSPGTTGWPPERVTMRPRKKVKLPH